MDLLKTLKLKIENSKFDKIEIQSIGYETFYNNRDGKLIIIYDDQIVQDQTYKESINQTAKEIRDKIKKFSDYNLWNTYLLILVSKNPLSEKYYYVERDVRNLRKYVLQSEDDILRVPFINVIENVKERHESNNNIYHPSSELSELYTIFKDNKEKNKKLSMGQIRKILEEIEFFDVEREKSDKNRTSKD